MVKNKQVGLDTNIIIDVLNNKKNIIESLKAYQEVYLPIMVCKGLLFGINLEITLAGLK
jgi:predicted nucleic acid-binding protein